MRNKVMHRRIYLINLSQYCLKSASEKIHKIFMFHKRRIIIIKKKRKIEEKELTIYNEWINKPLISVSDGYN